VRVQAEKHGHLGEILALIPRSIYSDCANLEILRSITREEVPWERFNECTIRYISDIIHSFPHEADPRYQELILWLIKQRLYEVGENSTPWIKNNPVLVDAAIDIDIEYHRYTRTAYAHASEELRSCPLRIEKIYKHFRATAFFPQIPPSIFDHPDHEPLLCKLMFKTDHINADNLIEVLKRFLNNFPVRQRLALFAVQKDHHAFEYLPDDLRADTTIVQKTYECRFPVENESTSEADKEKLQKQINDFYMSLPIDYNDNLQNGQTRIKNARTNGCKQKC
jgi:hypothetical protein